MSFDCFDFNAEEFNNYLMFGSTLYFLENQI